MTDRKITRTRKGYDGDILALCNPDKSWSPRFKNDAIRDIENNVHNYFMEVKKERFDIDVVLKRGSKHLVTDKETSSNNNLNDLTNC